VSQSCPAMSLIAHSFRRGPAGGAGVPDSTPRPPDDLLRESQSRRSSSSRSASGTPSVSAIRAAVLSDGEAWPRSTCDSVERDTSAVAAKSRRLTPLLLSQPPNPGSELGFQRWFPLRLLSWTHPSSPVVLTSPHARVWTRPVAAPRDRIPRVASRLALPVIQSG
jgi:hypothetical protein